MDKKWTGYRSPWIERYKSRKAWNRIELWWQALRRNPDFQKDFQERAYNQLRGEDWLNDKEMKDYFAKKYNVTLAKIPYDEPDVDKVTLKAVGGIYGTPLEGHWERLDGGDPVSLPDWPNLIHLVINPRRPKREIHRMVDYYCDKAKKELPPSSLKRKYERIDYERYSNAIDMWDMRNGWGKKLREIVDEYYPDKGDEWEKRNEELKAEGKSDDEIRDIEDKERPSKETRVKRVEEMIEAADDLIMGGYRGLI